MRLPAHPQVAVPVPGRQWLEVRLVTEGESLPVVRMTRQRTAVADVLSRVDGFRSAQDLHDLLRQDGASVGLTTVYRHLQALAEAGHVDVLRTGDGEAVYRRCPTESHHHHLVCRSCGRSIEVEGPEVEAWATAIAEEHGFTEVSHTVEVFGTCGSCARKARRKR